MVLQHQLGHPFMGGHIWETRLNSRETHLVYGVTQFDGGVKPRRSVHAIQDGVVLGPTVRIRIQRAKDHVENLSLAILTRTARAISHNVPAVAELAHTWLLTYCPFRN